MSEPVQSSTPAPVQPTTTDEPSTGDVAKDRAGQVAQGAKESGQHVADVAKDRAGDVAGEARHQARDLVGRSRDELRAQAGQQQQRVAAGLRSLGDELRGMARGSQDEGQQGVATDLAHQGAERAHAVAQWLEDRGPDDVLDDVRDLARRRPRAVLGIAAVAGLVVGRLGRGLKEGPPEPTGATSTPGGARREQPVADAGSTWTPAGELDTPPAGSSAVPVGTGSASGGGLTS